MAEIVRRDGNSLQISGAMVARMFLTEYLGNSSAERPLCEPAQLALDTLEQMPPQGPISWDYDRIALKAAALLLQDVPKQLVEKVKKDTDLITIGAGITAGCDG